MRVLHFRLLFQRGDVLLRRRVRRRWWFGCSEVVPAAYPAYCRHTLVVPFLCLLFDAPHYAVVLFPKDGAGRGPRLVGLVVVVVDELGLEESAFLHLADKEDCFRRVRDDHFEVDAFELALVGLRGVRGCVGVGGIYPGGVKVLPHFQLVFVRYHEPFLELGEELQDGNGVVPHVLRVNGIGVLLGDNGDDDLPPDLVEYPLVEVVRPLPELLLLQALEVAAFCFVRYL